MAGSIYPDGLSNADRTPSRSITINRNESRELGGKARLGSISPVGLFKSRWGGCLAKGGS